MSLLAQKIGLLEERRGQVAALEKEIGEMLGIVAPKRTYQKRSHKPPEAPVVSEDEPRTLRRGYVRVGRRLQGQKTSQEEEAEILRLAKKGRSTGLDIMRATGRSLATINRVLRDAKLKLSQLRKPRQTDVVNADDLATRHNTSPDPNAHEKKIIELRKAEKSQEEIATTLHMDTKAVRTVLKKHGLNRPTQIVTEAQQALVLKLKAEGKYTVPEIIAKAGIGATTYYRIINEAKEGAKK